MHTADHIQELALQWKASETQERFERIRDALLTYITKSALTRLKNLSDDEEQELFIRLFVDKSVDHPCQLKRSLRSYNDTIIGQTGTFVPFLSYFKQMIMNRVSDICRKRDNYTARNPDRRRYTKHH